MDDYSLYKPPHHQIFKFMHWPVLSDEISSSVEFYDVRHMDPSFLPNNHISSISTAPLDTVVV